MATASISGDSQRTVTTAPTVPHSTASSPAKQHASFGGKLKASAATFRCPRCFADRPLSSGTAKGNQFICVLDVKSYKCLSDHWKTNPQLRQWWTAKSKEAQAVWYQKQHSLAPGTKRTFDEVSHEESTTNTEFTTDEAAQYGSCLPIQNTSKYLDMRSYIFVYMARFQQFLIYAMYTTIITLR